MTTLSIARILIPLCIASCAVAQDKDALRFARILSDNMVLQQGKPIRLWGWAQVGAKVRVTITQDAAIGEAAASDAASKPATPDGYSVTTRYAERNPPRLKTQELSAAADSGGRWSVTFPPAKASFQPTWLIARAGDSVAAVRNVLIGEIWLCAGQSNMGWGGFNRKDREVGSSDYPGLRYIAWEDSWYKPRGDVARKIQWQECSPKTAARFSAVPYLFGSFLHRYLKVPVGVINVARGGTLGQTWCMREELDAIDTDIMRAVLAEHDAQTAVWDDPAQVAGLMKEWEQRCDEVRAQHKVKLARHEADPQKKKKAPRLRLPKKPGDARAGWSPPAGLFNATVMPIRDLRLRGVLYYQGENNNFMRWTRYESTFPKVPASFRRAFGDDTLPFGCISQPGWGNFGSDPEVATIDEGYAIIRDIQTRSLAQDPHGDMIATYPTGNSYIHPAEKLPVAEYASLWALAKVYGEPVVHRGNKFTQMKKKGDKLYMFFDSDPVVYERWKHIKNNAAWQVIPCARQGKAELQGFIIAGADRRWYPAKARQTRFEGTWSIELHSDLVSQPVAARYGWANWPTGNLVGRERLPIPTFRTDDWPIPAGMNYSDEVKKASSAKLKELKSIAKKQALDRKLRQLGIDLPKTERELYSGDADAQIESKIRRLQALLDEFTADRWLSRQLKGYRPDLEERLKALREGVGDLKKK